MLAIFVGSLQQTGVRPLPAEFKEFVTNLVANYDYNAEQDQDFNPHSMEFIVRCMAATEERLSLALAKEKEGWLFLLCYLSLFYFFSFRKRLAQIDTGDFEANHFTQTLDIAQRLAMLGARCFFLFFFLPLDLFYLSRCQEHWGSERENP